MLTEKVNIIINIKTYLNNHWLHCNWRYGEPYSLFRFRCCHIFRCLKTRKKEKDRGNLISQGAEIGKLVLQCKSNQIQMNDPNSEHNDLPWKGQHMVRSLGSEITQTQTSVEIQALSFTLAIWPQESCLSSLRLNVFIYNMEIKNSVWNNWVYCGGLNVDHIQELLIVVPSTQETVNKY